MELLHALPSEQSAFVFQRSDVCTTVTMWGEGSCIQRLPVLKVFSITRIFFIRKHQAELWRYDSYINVFLTGGLDARLVTRRQVPTYLNTSHLQLL